MKKREAIPITPETRVGDLLASMPELEPVLISLSPKFQKLKHPVLRKTVGRVATLQQVARVGNLPVRELIRSLREAAGQPEWSGTDPAVSDASPINGTPSVTLDIRPDVEAGKHPMAQVLAKIRELKPGEILALTAPFEPAPLLDQIRKQGYRHQIVQQDPEAVVIWIQKPVD